MVRGYTSVRLCATFDLCNSISNTLAMRLASPGCSLRCTARLACCSVRFVDDCLPPAVTTFRISANRMAVLGNSSAGTTASELTGAETRSPVTKIGGLEGDCSSLGSIA